MTNFKMNSEWKQVWLHAGMISFANRLLTDQAILAKELEEELSNVLNKKHKVSNGVVDNIFTQSSQALIDSDPEELMMLGRQILLNYLKSQKALKQNGTFLCLNIKKHRVR